MEGSKELKENYKKFNKSLEKCPICKGKMIECNEAIIKKARDSTILMNCSNCEILIGRYS